MSGRTLNVYAAFCLTAIVGMYAYYLRKSERRLERFNEELSTWGSNVLTVENISTVDVEAKELPDGR